MIVGKLIAGIFGYFLAGPFGAVIGIFVGHTFDRGLGSTLSMGSPEQLEKIKNVFFDTIFQLMGSLAKADGHISASEVSQAEQIMVQMGLNTENRQRAIALFKAGSQPSFKFAETVDEFKLLCGRHDNLKRSLLIYLISLALADGEVHSSEHRLLLDIAIRLGFSNQEFERLLEMVLAQHSFAESAGGTYGSGQDIPEAYRALGIGADCTDKALKRAYRKLMSQHHPDKLIAQGVPEEIHKVATEKAQEIQAAYELIKNHRK